jgi:hypothetical protein
MTLVVVINMMIIVVYSSLGVTSKPANGEGSGH